MNTIFKITIAITLLSINFSCTKNNFEQHTQDIRSLSLYLNILFNQIETNASVLQNEIENILTYEKDNKNNHINDYIIIDNVLYANNDNNLSIYSNKYSETNQLLKNKLNMLISSSDIFIEIHKKLELEPQISIYTSDNIIGLYPPKSIISFIDKDFDINKEITTNFESYWISEPYTDTFGEGYIFSYNTPIISNNKIIASCNFNVSLTNFNNKYIHPLNQIIIFTTPQLYIAGLSNKAVEELKIHADHSFFYYSKSINNLPLSEEYRLDFIHNEDYLKSIAKNIKDSLYTFKLRANKINYNIHIEKLITGHYIIGLQKSNIF